MNNEQKRLRDEADTWYDAYLRGAITSDEADTEADTEAAITAIYGWDGLPRPQFIWVDSPDELAKLTLYCDEAAADGELLDDDTVRRVLDQPVGNPEGSPPFSNFPRVDDVAWMHYYQYACKAGIVELSSEDAASLDVFKRAAMGVFTSSTFRTVVILCRMPSRMHFREGRLHHETEPALQFRNGSAMDFLEGMSVPAKYIDTPAAEMPASFVLEEENAQIRAALLRKMGAANFIAKAGGTVVQQLSAVALYQQNPIGDWYQHGDVLIKPKGDSPELVPFDSLSEGMIDRLVGVSYTLYHLNVPDIRLAALYMTNPSTGEQHCEWVPDSANSIFEALCWRNNMTTLPKELS